MTVHIASDTLVVAELSAAEKFSREEIKEHILSELKCRGLACWNSMELQLYGGDEGTLIFAEPVHVFLPEYLLRLAAHYRENT